MRATAHSGVICRRGRATRRRFSREWFWTSSRLREESSSRTRRTSIPDDGNIAIQYNHPAINVVLADVAERHWDEIDRKHQDALATHEALITPLGANKFDDLGKKALWGRCYMFMDAQDPQVIRVARAAV